MTADLCQGILPYTLIPATTSSPASIAFLLWRDRRQSVSESSAYFSYISCPRSRQDANALDALVRGFTNKTKDVFATNTLSAAVNAKHLIAKLYHPTAAIRIEHQQHSIHIIPVRFVAADMMQTNFADKGDAVWIRADDLVATLQSDRAAVSLTVTAKPLITQYQLADEEVSIPLHLPFTVLMRSDDAMKQLTAIMTTFNAQIIATQQEHNESDDEHSLDAATNHVNSVSHDTVDTSGVTSAATPPLTSFVCAKCRGYLFNNVDTISHTTGDGNTRAFVHKTSSAIATSRPTCSSYFTQPLSSLCDTTQSEGNILCPKCQTRIGTFSWAGEQCSCTQWVTPAFKITKSKVDEKVIITPTRQDINATSSRIIRFNPFAAHTNTNKVTEPTETDRSSLLVTQ